MLNEHYEMVRVSLLGLTLEEVKERVGIHFIVKILRTSTNLKYIHRNNMKVKFFITTTVPMTLGFFRGNLSYLNQYYDVTAISSNKEELKQIAKEENIQFAYIPMKRQISILWDLFSLFKFIFLFLKERPKIVHGNTPKASLLSMLAAWITLVPIRIYMCHGLRYQGTQGKLRKLLMLLERISCFCATEVICVSKGVRDTLIQDGICKEGKAVVVGYGSASGIDLDYFSKQNNVNSSEIRKQLNISENSFVYIFVGRIVKDKGINELIQAFTEYSQENTNIDLLLVGKEENLNPISQSSRDAIKNNQRIHAVGGQKDIRPFLSISDVMTFPSYREGFGMVLIEAAALGIPAISSNIIGCNEIIENGLNGQLIPPKDSDALLCSMKWFYEHRNSEVDLMKKNAREFIQERYERHKVWQLLLDEYKRLEINF